MAHRPRNRNGRALEPQPRSAAAVVTVVSLCVKHAPTKQLLHFLARYLDSPMAADLPRAASARDLGLQGDATDRAAQDRRNRLARYLNAPSRRLETSPPGAAEHMKAIRSFLGFNTRQSFQQPRGS